MNAARGCLAFELLIESILDHRASSALQEESFRELGIVDLVLSKGAAKGLRRAADQCDVTLIGLSDLF